MIGRTGTSTVLLACALALAWASPAYAQDDSPAAEPPVDDSAPDPVGQDGESDPTEPETGEGGDGADGGRLTVDELAERRLQGQQNRELLSVEQDVSNLKERVFRSKATLQLLRELVIEGATLGSRVSIWHINDLSGAYAVESVQYFLDGKAVFSRTDTSGGLAGMDMIEIHAQTLPPGAHSLQVNMVLRGNGHGVFSYLRAYSFKVQSSYTFTVEDGKVTTVKVELDEKGGPFTSFVDRPSVAYEESMENLRGE